jgi:GT2 family glycosyltransferase
VSTNAREHLLECLDSVFANPPSAPFEVLALDNASTDGTAEAVRERFGDRVQLVGLERRRGKAENDSDLMARARGEWFLLLNEDSRLERGAADRLVEALEVDPRAAAAGATLLDPRGRAQPSAWRFPGVAAAASAAVFLHRRLVVQSTGEATRAVDWAQSAGLLVRKAAFDEIGPLDPRFFVYSDEVDWQKRAHDAGWHVLFVPAARVTHHEQLSTGVSARRRIVEFSRNRDLYMRKHHGGVAALVVRLLTAWTYALRALAALVLPGRDARRYALHAYHSLFPGRGEGLREAAAEPARDS